MIMVPYVKDQGAIHGYRPGVEKRVEPRSKGFRAPHEVDPHWRDRAACRNSTDPELWFPVGDTGGAYQQAEDAKAVCFRCPVIDACLSWALATKQEAGVWGGMSEKDRESAKRREARERQNAAKASRSGGVS